MLPEPSIACRVLRPFTRPIAARAGDYLVIWPGHQTQTLTVYAPDRVKILREAYCAEGHLYGDLLHLFLDARIVCLSVASERALLGIAS